MALTLTQRVTAARKAGVPIVAIDCPNPSSTMVAVDAALTELDTKDGLDVPAIIRWNCINGFRPRNKAGQSALAALLQRDEYVKIGATVDDFAALNAALIAVEKLPDNTIIYMQNAHRVMGSGTSIDPKATQGIWNVRDPFKASGRMLILLAPRLELPIELQHDVVHLVEPLPGEGEIREIVTGVYAAAQDRVEAPNDDTVARAVDTLRGLPSNRAEEAAAMCLTPKGLDLSELFEAKRSLIEKTPGLLVNRDTETFDAVGGCENVKRFLRLLHDGPERPSLIAWIDELEKTGLGHSGDSSGTNSDSLGVFLTATQEHKWNGATFVGHPGSGKSLIAKTAGATFGIPTISLDFGAAKSKWVGESEARVRELIRTLYAIGGNKVFFIATCNKLDSLPPELKRRFRAGVWFFDLPTVPERVEIWEMNMRRFNLDKQKWPNDTGWTGADIFACCDLAYRLHTSLIDASSFVVPISKSDPDTVEQLRLLASNRFISAASPGAYVYNPAPIEKSAAPSGRRIR